MKILNQFSEGINRVINWFLTIALAVMVCVYFAAVFFRFVLNSGIPWAEEITRYLNVMLVLFGSGVAARNREHINVSALESGIKNQTVKRWLFILQYVLLGAYFLFTGWVGFGFASKISHVSPSLRIPMAVMYSIVSVASVVIAFQSFVYALNLALKLEAPVEHSEVDEYIKAGDEA